MPTKKRSPRRKPAAKRRSARPSKTARTHVLVRGSARSAARLAARVHDVDPKALVEVTLTLKGPKLPSPGREPEQSMSPAVFAATYGASEDQIKTVTKAVEKYGLQVAGQSRLTRSVRVRGTAKQMEAAFRPNLGVYRDASGVEFRDRAGPYYLPSALHGIVTAVVGFGQRRVARRRAQLARAASAVAAPLTPKGLEDLYAFPPVESGAAAQTIAIGEFGGGYFAEDLTAYCSKYGRPVPTVNPVPVNRPAYTLQQILALPAQQRKDELDSSIEVMMDVEVIAGLSASATLNVYFATFDQKGWVDLLNQVIEDHPVALSLSWGLAEDDSEWSAAARDAINERLNAAALLGITVCVAAGDDGSGDEETDGRAHVDFPSSSPFVLGVGGTMIPGAVTPGAEVVWWEAPGRRTQNGGGATGGGVSVFFDRPAWQNIQITSLNPGSIVGRVVPDVAALAGDPMYDLIILGKDQANGGTSASAPLWTALIARINGNLPANKRQRFLTPLLYLTTGRATVGQSACNDVTTGNNASRPQPGKGYKASTGYDAVSGWGTPKGTALQAALAVI